MIRVRVNYTTALEIADDHAVVYLFLKKLHDSILVYLKVVLDDHELFTIWLPILLLMMMLRELVVEFS